LLIKPFKKKVTQKNMNSIWQNLPHDLHAQIITQISDFKLWCNARFVSRKWLELILEDQDKNGIRSIPWRFVKFRDNAFRLPNGVIHGIHYQSLYNDLYKFGKLFSTYWNNDNQLVLSTHFERVSISIIQYSYINIYIGIKYYTSVSFAIKPSKIQCNRYIAWSSEVLFKMYTLYT
jgi:hypothetical protein